MRHIAVSSQCDERREEDSAGRPAGIPKRPGSWNLSNGYIFFYAGRLRSHRSRYSAIRDQERSSPCVKAYSSAVGAGAFVSEIFGDEADELRRRGGDGGEFGATTGRPRRMGWFDCVASKYGCRMQGTTDVAF